MVRDFLIVPPKKMKIKEINQIFDRLMSNKKVRISSRNYVIIGNDEKVIFDVSNHIIKGRFLKGAADKEKNIVNQLISNIGTKKIYMHYYGDVACVKNTNTISI